MNLTDMRNIVRRDLHDEDAGNYRWTDNEIDRHIAHAVKDFSGYLPWEQKTTIATTSGSREIDISAVTGRVMVEAAEYPVDNFPRRYQRFSLWGDTLSLLGDEIPDGVEVASWLGGFDPTKLEETNAEGYRPFVFEARAALARACDDPDTAASELSEAQRLFREMQATGHANRLGDEPG